MTSFVHSRYGMHACRVAFATLLHRRLQRLCYLHHCSDCYLVERTSSRVGLPPLVDQAPFTAHAVHPIKRCRSKHGRSKTPDIPTCDAKAGWQSVGLEQRQPKRPIHPEDVGGKQRQHEEHSEQPVENISRRVGLDDNYRRTPSKQRKQQESQRQYCEFTKLIILGPSGRFSKFPATRRAGKPPLDGLIVGVMAYISSVEVKTCYGSGPKTATPFGVPTNTLPLTIVGVMNLLPAPN
jgi:hypothetical protein